MDQKSPSVKPVLVARLSLGDVDDPVVFAGFIISEWEKTARARALKDHNLNPTMWRLGAFDPSFLSQNLELWCEDYDPEDVVLARLAGLIQKD